MLTLNDSLLEGVALDLVRTGNARAKTTQIPAKDQDNGKIESGRMVSSK